MQPGEGNAGVSSQRWDETSSGWFYMAQMEAMPRRYAAIFNAASLFTLCLYLIMLCEFWIFPPALKWNVNY